MNLKDIKNATNAQLSQAKAEAAETPGEDTSKLIDAINKEFEARAAAEEKEEKLKDVRVKAKVATSVDGVTFAEGQEGKLTGKQFNAVSRHFEKLAALVLFIGLLCGSVMAQQDNPVYLCQTNDTVGTNLLNGKSGIMAIASSTATNLYIPIPNVNRYRFVSVFYRCQQMSGTATDVNLLHLDFSPDGTLSNLVSLANVSLTMATTAAVKGNTNLDLASTEFVYASYITNACATIQTNIIVCATYKSRHFGAADKDAPVFVLNTTSRAFDQYSQAELPEHVKRMLIEAGEIEPQEPTQLVRRVDRREWQIADRR